MQQNADSWGSELVAERILTQDFHVQMPRPCPILSTVFCDEETKIATNGLTDTHAQLTG